MGTLHKRFEDTMIKIGLMQTELPTAVFYSAPVGIRFEIGGKERVYLPKDGGVNPVYVENALYRAKRLLQDLLGRPGLLRIDSYPEETDAVTGQMLSRIGLPAPDESFREECVDSGNCFLREHLYWDLTKGNLEMDKLLSEIIKSDIGGFSGLCSNVYLLYPESAVLYHLYDDRGADIVAADKRALLPLYRKYSDWILQYDRVKIDRVFADSV